MTELYNLSKNSDNRYVYIWLNNEIIALFANCDNAIDILSSHILLCKCNITRATDDIIDIEIDVDDFKRILKIN